MSIFRSPLTNAQGRVKLRTMDKAVLPVGSHFYRGLPVDDDGVVAGVSDTGQPRDFIGGVARDSSSGLLLLGDGAATPYNVPMDGMLVDAQGALLTDPSAAVNTIHEGVGLRDAVSQKGSIVTTIVSPVAGFPEFGQEGASNLVVSASLEDASNIGGGTILGNHSYVNGGLVFEEDAGIYWRPSAADTSALQIAGRITVWVHDTSIFTKEGIASQKVLLSTLSSDSSGNYSSFWRKVQDVDYFDCNNNVGSSFDSRTNLEKQGKRIPCRIDFSWSSNTLSVYIDHILVSLLTTSYVSSIFNEIWIGSPRSVNVAYPLTWQDIPFSHFEVSKQPITLTVDPFLSNGHFYGDSFVSQGDYPDDSVGWKFALVGTAGGGIQRPVVDNGLVLSAQRFLHRQGRHTGVAQQQTRTMFTNYAVGGSGLVSTPSLSEQLDLSLVTNTDNPSLAVVYTGSGDISDVSNVPDSYFTDGTLKTAYETQIGRLKTAGCQKIIICTMVSQEGNAQYMTDRFRRRTDWFNVLVKEIVSADSSVFVADCFTKFGGYNYDPNDIKGGHGGSDRHPSISGSGKLGSYIGDTIAFEAFSP